MSTDVDAIPGDSGGPWYWNRTAVGIHGGNCINSNTGGLVDAFTLADLTDENVAAKIRSFAMIVRSETLPAPASAVSVDYLRKLVMQNDGNLVEYRWQSGNWVAEWSSQTFVPGSRAVMQGDGNFVVYTPSNNAVWQSGTNQPGSYVVVQNDKVIVRDNSTTPRWISH